VKRKPEGRSPKPERCVRVGPRACIIVGTALALMPAAAAAELRTLNVQLPTSKARRRGSLLDVGRSMFEVQFRAKDR